MISLLKLLLLTATHLILVGMDVAAFFLMIRALMLRWPKALVQTFNRIGAPLVDPLMARMEAAMGPIGRLSRADQQLLMALILLAGFEVTRFVVAAIALSTTSSQITVWWF